MELDSIKRIVQTEQEAKDIIKRAQEEAEKIIQNAINSKEQKELFSKRRVEETKQKLEDESKKQQKDTIAKIFETTDEKCKQLEKQASEKMQIAVDTIFKEVIS